MAHHLLHETLLHIGEQHNMFHTRYVKRKQVETVLAAKERDNLSVLPMEYEEKLLPWHSQGFLRWFYFCLFFIVS